MFVVVVMRWARTHLNPHPLKAEGAAPKDRCARNKLSQPDRTKSILKKLDVIAVGLWKGGAEAADDAVLAQGDHGVEEGRGDGLADDGYAGGVDEEAGFYSGGLGYGAGGVIAGVVIPLG